MTAFSRSTAFRARSPILSMQGASLMIKNSTLDTIGGTPVVRLNKIVPPDSADVLVKLEYFNPTGSYKDRMAKSMIENAEQRGTLKPGMTVVEYTGGSTGIVAGLRLRRQGLSLSKWFRPTHSRRRSCARWKPSAQN